MDGPTNAQKFDGSLQKVPLTHGKLIEVDGRCRGCTKVDGSLRKFLPTHGMLMEGPTDARKVDGRFRRCTESQRKLTEGPAGMENFR